MFRYLYSMLCYAMLCYGSKDSKIKTQNPHIIESNRILSFLTFLTLLQTSPIKTKILMMLMKMMIMLIIKVVVMIVVKCSIETTNSHSP